MTHMIEWRAVEDWPYEVSSDGRVRRSEGRCGTKRGKVLKPGRHKYGYPYVVLYDRDRVKTFTIHRLVGVAFLGKPKDEGMMIAHNDGDPTNNRVDNLRWDTMKGNCADRRSHGPENTGSKNGMARLTETDVVRIRELSAQGMTGREIAERYGLTRKYAEQIARSACWKHVQPKMAAPRMAQAI